MIKELETTPEILACLIIDDPLLRPQYGWLNYKILLEEMRMHKFFTEIAFIPWNYKRSNAETVKLFRDNPDYYAICVHGCNHTRNEFGEGNYEKLSALSSTALWRMEQHWKITGLSYDHVIVFPQGRFSSIAMKALKDHGYLAAFNSNIQATDAEKPPASEYHPPATKIYHDFPLFLRRYPKDRIHFIDDIKAGRPIIIVQHPGDFKNGYKAVTELVDWINSLGNIKWRSLKDIAEYYLVLKNQKTEKNTTLSRLPVHVNIKIATRRLLSEIRDNYVERNNLMMKIYELVRG